MTMMVVAAPIYEVIMQMVGTPLAKHITGSDVYNKRGKLLVASTTGSRRPPSS